MNLSIDIGNTRIKAGLFNGDKLLEIKHFDSLNRLLSEKDFIKKAKQGIIGSVVDGLDSDVQALQSIIPIQVFTTKTKIPLKNLYQSVSTLGSDRLSASIGAYFLYPDKNVLTIDAGTCIKYNFCNNKNEYIGGAISPGITMRFKALNHFTSKLPLIEEDYSYRALIGNTTKTSILSGVLNGAICEIDGLINQYQQQFPDLICVLTGGDSEFLSERLKSSIFVHQNLVLKGLNDILNYNLETQ